MNVRTAWSLELLPLHVDIRVSCYPPREVSIKGLARYFYSVSYCYATCHHPSLSDEEQYRAIVRRSQEKMGTERTLSHLGFPSIHALN